MTKVGTRARRLLASAVRDSILAILSAICLSGIVTITGGMLIGLLVGELVNPGAGLTPTMLMYGIFAVIFAWCTPSIVQAMHDDRATEAWQRYIKAREEASKSIDIASTDPRDDVAHMMIGINEMDDIIRQKVNALDMDEDEFELDDIPTVHSDYSDGYFRCFRDIQELINSGHVTDAQACVKWAYLWTLRNLTIAAEEEENAMDDEREFVPDSPGVSYGPVNWEDGPCAEGNLDGGYAIILGGRS